MKHPRCHSQITENIQPKYCSSGRICRLRGKDLRETNLMQDFCRMPVENPPNPALMADFARLVTRLPRSLPLTIVLFSTASSPRHATHGCGLVETLPSELVGKCSAFHRMAAVIRVRPVG